MKTNLFKNRTVIGVISIICALVICFVLMPFFNNLLSAKAEIIRAKEYLKRGTVLSSDMFEIATVGKYNLPPDVITNVSDIAGKYLTADIYPGDYLLSSKVADELQTAEQILTTLDGEKVAMSISIKSFANGVSGKLKGGDIVSIVIAEETGFIPPELQYVKVVTSTTQTGQDIDDMNIADNTDAQNLPATVTLLVNEYQAIKLAQFEKQGNIHIALVCRGDNQNAGDFIAEQDKYLSSKAEEGGTDE